MSHIKSKRSAPTIRGNRTDAILKRIEVVQKRVDRQIAGVDASLKTSEPIFLKMKAALHIARGGGQKHKLIHALIIHTF